MNPPPGRGGRSRYGQHHQQHPAFPFVVDPTEGPPGVRAFFPAPEAGAAAKPSSSSVEQQRYGRAAAEISLAHGMQHHRYHQFGVEGTNRHQQDGGASSGSLPRHSSSPPGFFSSPVVVDNSFQSARGGGGNEIHQAASNYNKKMKAPVNLPRQGTLTQISEDGLPDLTENMHAIGHSEENITSSNVVRSSGGFSIGPWEDSNSIAFSSPSSKPGIHNNDDIIASLSNYELQFGVTKEASGGVDRYLQMQHDQVPFRVRAKRGCATHPRSIAERERRTRISEKLRKLQALVPNMDKQTSTADMLDLAVEHIRGLQSELQALKEEKDKCTCRGNHHSGN